MEPGVPGPESEITLPPRYYWTQRLLFGAVLVIYPVMMVLALRGSQEYGFRSVLLIGLLALSFCGGIALMRHALLEDTLRLTSEAIRKTGFLGAVRCIRWSDVVEVHARGAILSLRSETDRINVNGLLFVEPAKFCALLQEQIPWLQPLEVKPVQRRPGRA
jgi:hypothetical protein